MIDMSSLSASMTSSLTPEPPPTTTGAKLQTIAAGSDAAAPGTATPSTDGFLQVLEMFLGGSPLPSSLLASTTITQTPSPETGNADLDCDLPQALLNQPLELDEATSERIASLLQSLGFQVKPADIQQLSPLDREQLGTALEFVQRNLARGTDPALVAENASLLLPRPWALDDADGSPMGTGEATGATDGKRSLPNDAISNLESLRAKIRTSLGQGESTQDSTANTQTSAGLPAAIATAGAKGDGSSSSGQQEQPKPSASAKKLASSQTQVPAWMQQIQQMTESVGEEKTAATVPRHLTPGGTTSELIGRQVLEKVQLQLGEGHRELKLRLWPEELGEVRLVLKMTEGQKVHANMVVENDAVRQAMLDAAPQLKEAMARQGLDLERLSVTVSQRDEHQASGQDQGGKDRRGGARGGNGNDGWTNADIPVSEELVLGEDTGIRTGRNSFDIWS